MLKNRSFVFVFFIIGLGFLIIVIAKLSSGLDSQKQFPGLPMGLNQMNKSMLLHESLGMNNVYESMGIVDLYVENLTEMPIIFTSSFDARIYIKNATGWELVQNEFSYPDVQQVLWTNKGKPAGFVFSFAPRVENISKPVDIRIFIFGKKENNGEVVGAYLDITLH